MSLNPVSFPKLTYELEVLSDDQRRQIKTLTDKLYSCDTADQARALISAEKEYSRCKDNIVQLAIAIETSESEFSNIISELSTLRTQITGKNNTLDTEKGLAELIKNLSGPIAVGIFVFGVTGPVGATAAAFSRFFGSTVGSTIESAQAKPIVGNNNNAPAPAAAQFTFRNVEKAWYKSCISLVKDKEPQPIVATLLRVLDTNDANEFDLQCISDTYKTALEKAHTEKDRLKKSLHDMGFIPMVLNSANQLASNIMSPVTTLAGATGSFLGRQIPSWMKTTDYATTPTDSDGKERDTKKLKPADPNEPNDNNI